MNKFTTIKERIIEVLDLKGVSKNKFYQDSGITYGILSQKNELKCDSLVKFLTIFPDVNPEYILLGKGSILREEGRILSQNGENFVVSEKIFREILEENKMLNREIGRLEGELSAIKKAGVREGEVAICAAAK